MTLRCDIYINNMTNQRNHWTEEEIQILKENYNILSMEELLMLLPTRTWQSIKIKAFNLKLTGLTKWTEKEIEILKENYNILSNERLLKLLPDRKINNIQQKAYQLDLTRTLKLKRCAKLLDNNIINANVWGFCLGDAHFSKDEILEISLKKDDHLYLKYIADYLDGDIKFRKSKYTYKGIVSELEYCSLKIGDKENITKLKEKLQVSNNKTINPPMNLSFIKTDDELLAMLIGIIDADGSISYKKNGKFKHISVAAHINWKSWYELLSSELEKRFRFKCIVKNYNSSKNLVVMTINRTNIYLQLKDFIIKHNLNHLERKWKI